MALQYETRVISTVTPTATGNADFTVGGGFTETPVGAIVFCTRNTAIATNETGVALSWGCTDGTDELCSTVSQQNGASTMNAQSAGADDRLVWVLNSTTLATLISGTFVSFISGGIRINFTTAPAAARTIGIILFFGDDCDCKVFDVPTMVAGGTDTVTVGFEAKFVLTAAIPDLTESVSADVDFEMGIGVSGTDLQTVAIAKLEDGSSRSDGDSSNEADFLGYGFIPGSGAPPSAGHKVFVDQWNATTLRFAVPSGSIIQGSPPLIGLAVRPSDSEAQIDIQEVTPTSNGDEVFTTGFRTDFAYGITGRPDTADTIQAGAGVSVGASDVKNFDHICMGFNDQNNQATSNCDTIFDEELMHSRAAAGGIPLIIAAPDAASDTTVDLAFTNTVATARIYSVLWVASPKVTVDALVDLPSMTASGAVLARINVVASTTLPSMTSAGAALERFEVAAAVTLPALSAAGVVSTRLVVTAPVVLPSMTSAGAALERFEVAAAVTLPALRARGTLVSRVEVAAPVVLPSMTSAGAALERFEVAAAVTLPALSAAGVVSTRLVVTAPVALPSMTSAGAALERFEVAAAVTLPALAAAGAVVAAVAVGGSFPVEILTRSSQVALQVVDPGSVVRVWRRNGRISLSVASSASLAVTKKKAAQLSKILNDELEF